ncbi:uncharacterized protein LOC131227209 [Magnolia sinica]|uniref:uncharacterized protein LOC131227209 n=1 Tax=Magnolia sinica TaxID=86752 RepID=UPI002659629A|nr:uncharacterized protein LOC131227209 [Magnolia sinica]
MATILRIPPLFLPQSVHLNSKSIQTQRPSILSFNPISIKPSKIRPSHIIYKSLIHPTFVPFAAYGGEAIETDEAAEAETQESTADEGAVENGANDGSIVEEEEKTTSVVMESLQAFKEALANGDKSMVAEIESFLLSIEVEKKSLESKVAALSQELSSERDRVIRISADFDNFRKRTERERLSLVTNVQGEVVESLLPVLDNFERAKTQIKVETEGEEKINNSYQSIYKQFVEILTSLGVVTVETVGNPFDPLLHEAIMREDSTEFEEGIILQEFRKGFKLGDRLLRPSMVKVSAGPGPAKPEETAPPGDTEGGGGGGETSKGSSAEEQGESVS